MQLTLHSDCFPIDNLSQDAGSNSSTTQFPHAALDYEETVVQKGSTLFRGRCKQRNPAHEVHILDTRRTPK